MKKQLLQNGRISFVVFAVVAVAACSPTSATKQLDAPVVAVSMKAGSGAPEVRRLVTVPVEAKAAGASVAADCTLTSVFYSANFTAPANLKLPDYGKASPAVTVSCSGAAGQGEKTANAISVDARNSSMAGAILLGPLGAGLVADTDGQRYYAAINVPLR